MQNRIRFSLTDKHAEYLLETIEHRLLYEAEENLHFGLINLSHRLELILLKRKSLMEKENETRN